MSTITFESDPTPGLVSVIVPTYHKDRFIGDTLTSLSRQSYSLWELIVVEDSSRGQTEQIVAEFARRHPLHRVSYSRNERNEGAAFSRNLAFSKARGEFVATLDADDRWMPDHLAASVTALGDTGNDIVYSTVIFVADGTDVILGLWGPDTNDLNDFSHALFKRNFVTPSATVMRRDVLADVGPWTLGIRYCEDADYYLRCIAAGKQFQHIGGIHCLYRKNHDGATTQRLCGTLQEFAEIAERYVESPGLRTSRARRYTATAYFNAALHHAQCDPNVDPSADFALAATLAWKAWRLRPRHLTYLRNAAKLWFVNLFRPARRHAPDRLPFVAPTSESKLAAA